MKYTKLYGLLPVLVVVVALLLSSFAPQAAHAATSDWVWASDMYYGEIPATITQNNSGDTGLSGSGTGWSRSASTNGASGLYCMLSTGAGVSESDGPYTQSRNGSASYGVEKPTHYGNTGTPTPCSFWGQVLYLSFQQDGGEVNDNYATYSASEMTVWTNHTGSTGTDHQSEDWTNPSAGSAGLKGSGTHWSSSPIHYNGCVEIDVVNDLDYAAAYVDSESQVTAGVYQQNYWWTGGVSCSTYLEAGLVLQLPTWTP